MLKQWTFLTRVKERSFFSSKICNFCSTILNKTKMTTCILIDSTTANNTLCHHGNILFFVISKTFRFDSKHLWMCFALAKYPFILVALSDGIPTKRDNQPFWKGYRWKVSNQVSSKIYLGHNKWEKIVEKKR